MINESRNTSVVSSPLITTSEDVAQAHFWTFNNCYFGNWSGKHGVYFAISENDNRYFANIISVYHHMLGDVETLHSFYDFSKVTDISDAEFQLSDNTFYVSGETLTNDGGAFVTDLGTSSTEVIVVDMKNNRFQNFSRTNGNNWYMWYDPATSGSRVVLQPTGNSITNQDTFPSPSNISSVTPFLYGNIKLLPTSFINKA